jgi:hypothetical protein
MKTSSVLAVFIVAQIGATKALAQTEKKIDALFKQYQDTAVTCVASSERIEGNRKY